MPWPTKVQRKRKREREREQRLRLSTSTNNVHALILPATTTRSQEDETNDPLLNLLPEAFQSSRSNPASVEESPSGADRPFVAALVAKIKKLKEDIKLLRFALSRRDATISRLESRLGEKDDEIAKLKHRLDVFKAQFGLQEIAEWQTQVAIREKER